MAATETLDTASAVLAAARAETTAANWAEVRRFQAAVDWAAMHSVDSIGPAAVWESGLPIAGEGAPLVAEFCVAELALALGMSTDGGRRYLGDAVETRYRLPKVWELVVSGALPVWRARKIAQATLTLPAAGALFVDTHLAPFAARATYAQLDRLVDEARVRFDPDEAEARRLSAAESRHFDVDTHQVSYDGTVAVRGSLDVADALDLDAAITSGAQALADLGCRESLDVRRSLAAGHLARREPTLDLQADGPRTDGAPPHGRPTQSRRQVVIYTHLTGDEHARVENTRSILSVQQVRGWCADPDTQVVIKPVIDLNEHRHTDAYSPTPALREQVVLTHPTCVFPSCSRPSRGCDLDHGTAWDEGGPTDSHNLAPLCRAHHRLKTHTAWTYRRTGLRTFVWTSPHGHAYTRDT